MMSYISPFQDYPNNPRTFIYQSVASQKITPTFQLFNSNSVSPKIFPITNTNPSHTQLKKVNYITYRFKPMSSLNKVDIQPQQGFIL